MKSQFLSLNAKDFLKGLALVVISSILTGLEQLIQNVINHTAVFSLASLETVGYAALIVALSYLAKNFITNSNDQLLTKENT